MNRPFWIRLLVGLVAVAAINIATAGGKESDAARRIHGGLPAAAAGSVSKDAPAVVIERAVIAIGNQLDPAKTARLERSQMAPRMNRIMCYLLASEKAGAKPDKVLATAIELVGASKEMAKSLWNPELVRSRVLENYAIMKKWNAFALAENISAMERGKAAVIPGGEFSGQQIEWDHIIPVNEAPELANSFANLRPLAMSLNRSKGAVLTADSLETARAFQGATRWRPRPGSSLEKALAKAPLLRSPGGVAKAAEATVKTGRAALGVESIAEGVTAVGGEEAGAMIAAGAAEGGTEVGLMDLLFDVLPFVFAW